METRDVTLGDFLDIEAAFDSNSSDIITKAAKWHELGDTICQWIGSKLGGRKITVFYPVRCGSWLWTNSYVDSMKMAVTHWGMQRQCCQQQWKIAEQRVRVSPGGFE